MKSNKREDILNAALVLFAERGFEGTTVPDIAKKAKVGAGTIYRYFESKEMLLNVLYQKHLSHFKEILQNDILKEGTSVREQFHQLFQNIIMFANRNIYALIFIDTQSYSHNLNEESLQQMLDFFASLGTMFEKGKQQGVIVPMPSSILLAMVYGSILYLYKTIRAGGLEETPELLASMEECCWNAICVHEQRV